MHSVIAGKLGAVVVLALVAITTDVLATGQIPDKILYNGEEFYLLTNPLEAYFNRHPKRRPKSEVTSTALWRGYVATFEFSSGGLVLKGIEIETRRRTADGKTSRLWKSVISDLVSKDQVLRIEWFTGILVLPFGEVVNYVHMGYASTYSNYILLEVRKGKFISERRYDHKQYAKFKEAQFQAFKKTEEYKKLLAKLRKKGNQSEESLDTFLRDFVVEYSSRFMVEDEIPAR